MSPYTVMLCNFTRVLVKKQLESQKRQLGKTAVVGFHCVYGQKDNRIRTSWKLVKSRFLKNVYKLSIATRFHISLACL